MLPLTKGNGKALTVPIESLLLGLLGDFPVVLFIDGTILAPNDPASAEAVRVLQDAGVCYKAVDCSDERCNTGAREVVAALSRNTLLPQIYARGWVGGIEELKSEAGRLATAQLDPVASECNTPISHEQLRDLISHVDYSSFDILENEEVRKGLKEYSKWPTYPQLYANGKLLGGLDVVTGTAAIDFCKLIFFISTQLGNRRGITQLLDHKEEEPETGSGEAAALAAPLRGLASAPDCAGTTDREVTWTTKSWLGLQKQRISVVLHTAIAEQIVNELACGEGGRVHGAKCLAVLAGVA
ncbi:hypothetical protein EMIHUDRAFT_209162 [Emiliania huxleyi CCMP1516]|uniref:Glutaredoxin domain-containing protein n=2 Tax=Emiliania huxleyi TaxID=2903 RepID=A0A0D3J7S9_EMIH1|nr:hypothetical protein EMIHUDRAFT_209162 [Emiliania huxleyi CCMP1516]EOD19564.1 hypothetical protein EMIHUDRAFT_209162 [Emiliania huxleyi CCMP1516]|eukprot:XP_005771993.1 hypothetical protein EMIHUDRAFT_209162 [Emiliania huxleyi CCMP1516]